MVHNLDKWVTHIPYCVRRSLLFCFLNLWFIVRIKNFHDQITTHSISMVFHISNVRRLSFWSDVLVNSNKYKRTKPSDCSERGLLNSFSCCCWNFFFFRFVCPFFIWYISHWQCMAIQRTYIPSHLFTRQKEQTENEKRSKTKKKTSSFECWCCCCIVLFDHLCLRTSVIVFVSFSIVVTHSISSPVCVYVST